jgi:hypothetical protein
MSDRPPLFVADPRRFFELVATEDAKTRIKGFGHFDDMVLGEIVRFGLYPGQQIFADVAEFYRRYFLQQADAKRLELYGHALDLVEHASVPALALLPFIVNDPDRVIVATAVIDCVSIAPLTDGDPMSRVKDIVEMIEDGSLKNEGAAFGALLNLGDERVCRLLVPLRDTLSLDAAREAIKCSTGFLCAATVEFYIDWLEGMLGDESMFDTVASGLTLLKRASRTDQVFTGYRPFPMLCVTPEEAIAMACPIPVNHYVRRIAPRLYALKRSESPPRIMPQVPATWGLEPSSDPLGMEA